MALTVIRGRAAVTMDDFSGGINLSNNPESLRPNEVAAALNMTSTTRGLVQRFGWDSIGRTTNTPKYLYWEAPMTGYVAVQEGSSLVTYLTEPLQSRNVVHTFSTSDQIACCSFGSYFVAVHPVDGVFTTGSFPPTALTSREATVTGNAITVWQNKVWVTGNGYRVWWSNAGDPTTWTVASDYVDILDVDSNDCTAIGNGKGMDTVGRTGLLLTKATSTYRIYDSTTGAYTTIDTAKGAAGPESIASGPDGVYMAGDTDVYRVRGDSIQTVSDHRISKFYGSSGESTVATAPIAWSSFGRLYFYYRLVQQYMVLEWVPENEAWWAWSVPSTLGAAAPISATSAGNGTPERGMVLAGPSSTYNVLRMPQHPDGATGNPTVPDEWDSGSGVVGAAFTPYVATRWFGGGLGYSRCDRVVIQGWCGDDNAAKTVSVSAYRDYDQVTAWRTLSAITLSRSAGSNLALADMAVIPGGLGVGRAFQLRLTPSAVSGTYSRIPDVPFDYTGGVASPVFGLTAIEAELTGLRS